MKKRCKTRKDAKKKYPRPTESLDSSSISARIPVKVRDCLGLNFFVGDTRSKNINKPLKSGTSDERSRTMSFSLSWLAIRIFLRQTGHEPGDAVYFRFRSGPAGSAWACQPRRPVVCASSEKPPWTWTWQAPFQPCCCRCWSRDPWRA